MKKWTLDQPVRARQSGVLKQNTKAAKSIGWFSQRPSGHQFSKIDLVAQSRGASALFLQKCFKASRLKLAAELSSKKVHTYKPSQGM
jgi:hypothetical protein